VSTSPFRFALPPSTGVDDISEPVRHLRDFLGDKLGRPTDVTVSRSYEVLSRNLLSGAVDAAWAPPFVCAQTEPRGGQVLVRAVRRGRSEYCSALVVRKGKAAGLRGLQGKRAAWVDPHSVAGYLLPVAYLRQQGYDPAVLFSDQLFAGSYPGAASAVLEDHADVAAVHALAGDPDSLAESLRVTAPGFEDKLEAVVFTDPVPSDGVLLGPRAADVKDALTRALLALPESEAGKALIDEVFHADAFEPARPMSYRALHAVAPRSR
jgi:phosphonate transport system substrate-binding protein